MHGKAEEAEEVESAVVGVEGEVLVPHHPDQHGCVDYNVPVGDRWQTHTHSIKGQPI